MDEKFSELLLEAVKKDDKKEFDSLMAQQPCGTLRLGRFPVLSLIYMYNASKIRRAYEEKFVRHNSWQELYEPLSIAADFRKVAGKCLRFYLEEVVSPVEMLLILDKTAKLKRVFPLTHMSQPVKQRLKSIYEVKYSLNLDFRGDDVVMDKRPKTRLEKRRIVLSLVSVLLCVAIAVSTPFVVNAFAPFITNSDGEILISDFSKIDFSSDKSYALKNDVVLPESFCAQEVNCQIQGNGKTVTVLSKSSPFGTINGKISNVVFNTQTALAETVAQTGVVENVVVNAVVDATVTQDTAFVATDNFGQIKNAQLNLSGTLNVLGNSEEILEEGIVCAGIAVNNNATEINDLQKVFALIQNCNVSFDNFSLNGDLYANASFAGVVGTNNAYVDKCAASGKITSDTMDVAGICVSNNYLLSNNKNSAEISQTSSNKEWNPLACGIVLHNYYAVDSCQNSGKISVTSTCEKTEIVAISEPAAMAAGIAYLSNVNGVTPYLLRCQNSGEVSAVAENIGVAVAGICTSSSGIVEKCTNTGNVIGQTHSSFSVYAAGIVDYAYGYIYQSASNCNITAKGNGKAYVGGIAALSYVQILQCASGGKIEVEGKTGSVGGVLGMSGALLSGESVYFGKAEACVSVCELNAVASAGKATDVMVGGIVGSVEEIAVLNEQTGEFSYYGGGATVCYFTGKFLSTQGICVGGITASCGKNVHDSNSYQSGNNLLHNFDGNFVADSCGVEVAIGTLVTGNGNNIAFGDSSNLGATFAALEDIQNITNYKAIFALLP